MNATRKQTVAASRVGIIRVPNQPTYRRLSVEVTHSQNDSQIFDCFERESVADILKKGFVRVRGDEPSKDISTAPSTVDIRAFKVEPGKTHTTI